MIPQSLKKCSGFSMVEVLSTISIIGILAATAIPNIGKINQSSKEAVHMRNAQNLAAVAISAQAAGLDFVSDDMDETLSAIATGAQVQGGSFDGSYFGMPNLSETERDEAKKFLTIANGSLIYSKTGDNGERLTIDPPKIPNIMTSPDFDAQFAPDVTSPAIAMAMPARIDPEEIFMSVQFYQSTDENGDVWNNTTTKTYNGDELTSTVSSKELVE